MIKKIILTILMVLVCSIGYTSERLAKYGQQITIDFKLFEVDGVDLRVDWTPAVADCEIMKDGGASTQCTNTATDEGSTYSIVLTATEMQAERLVLKVVDAATKVFLDHVVIIETYGNASALHAFDLDTASVAQSADNDTNLSTLITQVGTAGDGLTAINLPNQTMDISGNITGNLSGSVGSVTGAVGSVTGAVGSVAGNVDGSVGSVSGHTNQTGDSFARIGVAGAGLSNINLPNQTMDIVGNITGNLSGSVGSVTGAVGSVTGHTNQTGDSFARIGAPAGASVSADIAAIEGQTDDIGVAGAGLSDLGGMSTTMKGQVNTEVDGALNTAIPGTPVAGSINNALNNQNEIILAGAAAGSHTTTTMQTDLTVTVNDQYNGRIITFTSDTATVALRNQQTDITDTVTTNSELTFTALTTAPSDGDKFVIN